MYYCVMEVTAIVTDTRGLASMLGISVGTAKKLIYSRTIPTFLVGRRRLVPLEAVRTFVSRNSVETSE